MSDNPTDPLRMAAVLVYARDMAAESYAETRHKEALQRGDGSTAAWWADVGNAVALLRANSDAPFAPDHTIN